MNIENLWEKLFIPNSQIVSSKMIGSTDLTCVLRDKRNNNTKSATVSFLSEFLRKCLRMTLDSYLLLLPQALASTPWDILLGSHFLDNLRYNHPSCNGSDRGSEWKRMSFYSLIVIRSHWSCQKIPDLVCRNICSKSKYNFKFVTFSRFSLVLSSSSSAAGAGGLTWSVSWSPCGWWPWCSLGGSLLPLCS